MITLAGSHWRFIVGLGTTQVATGLAVRAGRGWAGAILLAWILSMKTLTQAEKEAIRWRNLERLLNL